MKKGILLILMLTCFIVNAQYINTIYDKVKKYPNNLKNIEDISYRIKNDFPKKEDQAQAVFTWIATHISYDLNYYYGLRASKRIYYRSKEERRQQLDKIREELISKTLKFRKGVCEGYATLFKAFCDHLDIPSVVINGYTKLNTKLIGVNPGFKNHSWNAVYFNKSWHLIDVTWAAGYEIEHKKHWIFNFNEHYFDQNPREFIRHHFPQDENWQLIKYPISKSEFFSKPIFYDTYFTSEIELSEKQKGAIKKQYKDKYVYLTFDKLPKNKRDILAMTRTTLTPKKVRFRKNNDGTFTAKIKVSKHPDFLTIYYKYKAILDFKIITHYE